MNWNRSVVKNCHQYTTSQIEMHSLWVASFLDDAYQRFEGVLRTAVRSRNERTRKLSDVSASVDPSAALARCELQGTLRLSKHSMDLGSPRPSVGEGLGVRGRAHS